MNEVALFDAQGCLSAQGFAEISAAPPGRAPAELAAHLAGCTRCQRRLLVTAMPSSGSSPRRPRPPLWRTWLVVVVCVLLVIMAMTLTRVLSAPPR
jgi:hypothetical protein